MKVYELKKEKRVISENYKYFFNKETGFFARWGKTENDDPLYSPFGPEILDLEISSGICSQRCRFCYKENGEGPMKNMSFDMFKTIFDKIIKNKILTQIAFGITDITTNPDFFKMMSYSRYHGVIPNYTTSGFGVTKTIAEETCSLCGAVAVSVHDKETAFNAIKEYTDTGMKQVNVHEVIYKENVEQVLELINCLATDSRTQKLNALVLLAYKPKGRNKDAFHPITSIDNYKKVINYAIEKKINLGFDSCSVPNVLRSYPKDISMEVDPCESTLFSFYCNVDGEFFPCSFAENEGEWKTGLSINDFDNFNDIWYNERIKKFRNNLIHSTDGCTNCVHKNSCRHCQLFKISDCYK